MDLDKKASFLQSFVKIGDGWVKPIGWPGMEWPCREMCVLCRTVKMKMIICGGSWHSSVCSHPLMPHWLHCISWRRAACRKKCLLKTSLRGLFEWAKCNCTMPSIRSLTQLTGLTRIAKVCCFLLYICLIVHVGIVWNASVLCIYWFRFLEIATWCCL